MFFVRHGQSEFNEVFSRTGRDPGVRDAGLTPRGREQARLTGHFLKARGIRRIVCSPYRRALETATIIGAEIGVTRFDITPLLGERALYSCDIGTPLKTLREKWGTHDLSAIPDENWWPKTGETQESIQRRVDAFMALESDAARAAATLAVSHWYFIFTATGLDLDNADIVWRDEKGRFHKQ